MSSSVLAAWIFGSLSFVFIAGAFWFSEDHLPAHKVRVLGLISAIFTGLFGTFFTGSLSIVSEGHLPVFGKVAIQSGGGIALFLVTLRWWRSPHGPFGEMAPGAQRALEQAAFQALPIHANHAEQDDRLREPLDVSDEGMEAERLWEEAFMRYRRNDFEGCLQCCQESLKNLPDFGPVQLLRARTYLQLRRPKEAYPDLDAVLAKVPDHGQALLCRYFASGMLGDKRKAKIDAQTLAKMGDDRWTRHLAKR